MTIKKRLYSSQNRFHQSIHESSRMYVGNLPKELKTYYREYDKEFEGPLRKANKNKFLSSCLASSLILCGDYHSSEQAQRTVLRLIRYLRSPLKKQKKIPHLCFEFLRAKDNLWVQSYQSGRISEETFLKRIEFYKWGFSWKNYEPLFHFAKKFKIPIIGMSDKYNASLAIRDDFAASLLANWLEKVPQGVFICLMGDYHLASQHLPKKIKEKLKLKAIKRKTVVIHQNHDELYLRFRRKENQKKVEVVELKKNVFCILNSPPWMKLHRHLQWLQSQELQGEERLDYFLKIQQTIAGFLQAPKKILSDGGDIEFESLGSNLNELASLAAKKIHQQWSGCDLKENKLRSQFYTLVWSEALGWLGSKIINPDRKIPGLQDFLQIQQTKGEEIAQYFKLEKKMMSQKSESRGILLGKFMKNQSPRNRVRSYQSAGRLLGQGLFEMIERGKISFPKVRSLFKKSFLYDGENQYFYWIEKVDQLNLRDFSSRDQL